VLAASCASRSQEACEGTEVRVASPGKLTVAADYSYPPFAFRGGDGGLTGFEVDLIEAVAKEMKLEARFVNRGAGALVTGLLAHRHDLAASGLRATPTLRQETCLSAPYLGADLGILVPKANPHTVEAAKDLRGLTVAVLDGSDAERWALDRLGRSTIASLPATDDLLTALQQDRADAVVADLPFAQFTQARSPDLTVAGRIDTKDGYVFAASKDNGPLIAKVDEAVAKLKESGAFRTLERRWFG
jgi:ABC-type amino acid transport substrate-binding protein